MAQAHADIPQGSNGAEPHRRDAAVMFYSHDSYGLGHLRRTLALAHFLDSRSQLIVTGSPLAHRFHFPPRTDYIKLPAVVKRGKGRYTARYLEVPFGKVRALRRDILLSAARHVRPDLLIVDNVPAGLKGELLPTLRYLKQHSCRLVLGLRDVVDEAEWVRRTWREDGSYELLDELYDLILVYGHQDVYDVTREYAFSPEASAKTQFVGYLRRDPPKRTVAAMRRELRLESGDRLVLVMAGGGGDGYNLLRAVVAAIELRSNGSRFDCVLLGGPLMPADDRRRVLELVARTDSIRFVDFVDDVASYVAAADVVVSMCGYNSVCELLSAGKSALVVPRIAPRREQLIRAELLSERGLLRFLHPDRLDGRRLLDEIERLLGESNGSAPRMPLDGLPATAAALDELLAARVATAGV
jgi:predicted glycosyltransferase